MGVAEGGIDLARIREHFLQGGPVESGVRSLILNSWQRCRLLGLSPDRMELPYRQDFDPEARLVRAADPVLDRLENRFAGSRMNIGLADAEGMVLARRFGERSLARRLPPFQVVPGFVFAERVAGTNGIGTALAERRLCRIHGAEHFAERGQGNACTAIPIRDLLSGRIEGVLSFACPRAEANPVMDLLIGKAADAIEHRLLEQNSARERALLRAYLDTKRGAEAGDRLIDGESIGVDELARSGLNRRDQTILREKAAELISADQRAAVEVTLTDGRRLTLVSDVVTGPSGMQGVAVEAVLHHEAPLPLLTVPGHLGEPHDLAPRPAVPPPRHLLGLPPARPATARPPATIRIPADADSTEVGETTADRRLVLVGEPGVGRYAVAARRRLELLSEASTRIGTTLDVRRTALELAEMAVPRLADHVAIDLPEAVLRGEEAADPQTGMIRVVMHGIHDDFPFYPVGRRVDPLPATPQYQCLTLEQAVLAPELGLAAGWISQQPEHAERLVARGVHSLIAAPLLARGVVLGIASFYRSQYPAPFGDDDRSLAQELATRAAICIDNARRYTREHSMVLALQRSLLPTHLPEQSAVEVAHRYQPAESEVGGDWFDIIPLSGTRVALVVGDVVGHGLHAAVTMGRLRTAARNYAELDLAPDEILTHLDNLVARLDREEAGEKPTVGGGDNIGATCLYAVYDPTSQQATVARAGHLPPALVDPDGTVTFPDLPAGPPLGLGGLPFESAEIKLPEGSQLVLYTDGLVEDRRRDPDTAFDLLRRALAHKDRPPDDTCRAILETVAPEHPRDDIALLVARTLALDPDRIADWSLPADPARVSEIRGAVTRRLSEWGLAEVSFTAELLLSELVTNAVRYGSGPIQVRLIHDRTLICEVSDTSSTAPHLRHATTYDEGGRGLFLVAQLAQAWGTRYTADGKVIWAECALETPGGTPEAAMMDWEAVPGLD
ncbi:SpoIIE family protein phosphatase [Streptomyces yaanensis]|uniref:SpoIIE family protein phosphatase n=1 Tax=Streptomyces yaanensis TaxID=1142239 RepID=A0ABV7SCS4_9ACTN|nr:SpoIIE family protein phosphatase [Streptomyces sp. CGMCC 4.7035]WNB99026.1 SpoIIE family protein phosphatase [Streptomyces sp. CGMCC 4.7035]